MVVDDFIMRESTNLLPSFKGGIGRSYLWNFGGAFSTNVTYETNGGVFGSGAIKAQVEGEAGKVLAGFRATVDAIQVNPNTQYELSYKIKLNTGMLAYPHVVHNNQSGSQYVDYTECQVTGNGEWQ